MKYFAYFTLIILLSNCNRNIYSAKDFYSNGQPRFKGKYIECQANDPIHPQIIVNEKKKFGEWRSFYQNGNLKEIRHYTKKISNCQTDILKEGIWKYYNQDGALYLTEVYRNDSLFHSEVDIYEGLNLVGKVIKSEFSDDSVIMDISRKTNQLISNSSFEWYYFKPIFLANNGYDQIESLIPGWYSPDKATPDYYNSFRSVEGVPRHFQSIEQTNDGYVGLMLYLGERSNQYYLSPDYTETLQTKLLKPLQKGETYCFKIRVRLSVNSGFSINKLGVLFSEKAIAFENTKSLDSASISFTDDLLYENTWGTLCSNFIATGSEHYLTIGRFASTDNLNIRPHSFRYRSPLNINESAYYLLDDIELYETNDSTECRCETSNVFIETETTNDPVEFTIGDTITLSNILFEFDSHQLNPNSFNVLRRLAEYMHASPETKIEITGHTDNVGNDEYNLKLSKQRANEVANWLVVNGIDKDRIKSKGVGNKYPIDLNIANSESNRRVEILITL